MRYRGECLTALAIHFQRLLGVLGFELHLNGIVCIVNQRVLHPDAMMIIATKLCHSATLHLTRELGATNIQEAMCSAVENGHLEIVQQYREWRATDYD